jgi:hypothetical protein
MGYNLHNAFDGARVLCKRPLVNIRFGKVLGPMSTHDKRVGEPRRTSVKVHFLVDARFKGLHAMMGEAKPSEIPEVISGVTVLCYVVTMHVTDVELFREQVDWRFSDTSAKWEKMSDNPSGDDGSLAVAAAARDRGQKRAPSPSPRITTRAAKRRLAREFSGDPDE